MKIVQGNLWDSTDDLILVTSNSYITKDGRLVMGRGAALELKNRRPDLPYVFASGVKNICGHLGRYGIIYELQATWTKARQTYGVFQVKYHFKSDASLELIEYSCFELSRIISGVLWDQTISINFPGIGYGRLPFWDVYNIVESLPDNVTLYVWKDYELPAELQMSESEKKWDAQEYD